MSMIRDFPLLVFVLSLIVLWLSAQMAFSVAIGHDPWKKLSGPT